jgi:hypothetical protein
MSKAKPGFPGGGRTKSPNKPAPCLELQNLLNPSAPRALRQPEAITLERARHILEIGAERGLKILFCEAVHALNDWCGAWSPLPPVPEKCSTDEILDLLGQHPHWFVPRGATVDV